MKYTTNDITCVICNWMQTRFTLGAVRSIRKYYPDMPVIVVDDGSPMELKGEFSRAYAREAYSAENRLDNDMEKLRKGANELNFKLIELPKHIGHGSSLDYGLDYIKTPLMLTMDNDIRLQDGGLIEEYLDKIEDDVYAVGTTFYENDLFNDGHITSWIDPHFSLYRKAPIKDLHLTFCCFTFRITNHNTLHIGTGAFIYIMLTTSDLHLPKVWKAVHYPEPEKIDKLWHLRKFTSNKPGDVLFDKWEELIDG